LKNILFLFCLLVGACGFNACNAPSATEQTNKTTDKTKTATVSEPESTAAATTATDVDKGKNIVLSFEELAARFNRKSDTLYVYNFWATWCKPCVAELPYFEKINEVYADKKLKMVLVSLDFVEQLDKKVLPFIAERQLKSEVVLLDAGDPNEWIDKVSEQWSGAIPGTLILKPSKEYRQFFERQFTYEELEALVKPLLEL